MVSRIERAVREVSDLRAFYLNLQKLRRQSQGTEKEHRIEEDGSSYGAKQLPLSEIKRPRHPKEV